MRAEHHLPHFKSPAEDAFPVTAEEVQYVRDYDGALLHLHLLNHHVVHCSLYEGQV